MVYLYLPLFIILYLVIILIILVFLRGAKGDYTADEEQQVAEAVIATDPNRSERLIDALGTPDVSRPSL